MPINFGLIALLGSGETSLAGGRVFDAIAQRLPEPIRIAVLETPAGFELNSEQVAGRVAEFLRIRLKNFDLQIDIIPARKRRTPFSPDEAAILMPLASANLIFMGPGSPTYTVRQLRGSLAWELVRARQRMGAALVFASAAAIAIGAQTLPVYEIYKVGEEVHSIPGLNLFGDFGLPISCITHWNNSDGGADVDTSRCFVGQERFKLWHDLLPPGQLTLGLDEHTGLIIDLIDKKCTVSGAGSVTILRKSEAKVHATGTEFPLMELGNVHWPETVASGISPAAMELAGVGYPDIDDKPPMKVMDLLEIRREARSQHDWTTSDLVRQQIADLGWQVQDLPTDQTQVKRKDSRRN
jgi:hypothetical protein